MIILIFALQIRRIEMKKSIISKLQQNVYFRVFFFLKNTSNKITVLLFPVFSLYHILHGNKSHKTVDRTYNDINIKKKMSTIRHSSYFISIDLGICTTACSA